MSEERGSDMQKLKSFGIFMGIILILAGVLFIVFDRQIAGIIAFVMGGAMTVTGIIRLVQALKLDSSVPQKNRIAKIIVAAIMIAAGLFLIIDHNAAMSLVGIVLGVFSFFCAFDRFSVAAQRKRLGQPAGMTVLFGILDILLGIFIMVASFNLVEFIVMFTGIYMLVEGIMIVISAGYLKDFEITEVDVIEGTFEEKEEE